MNLAEITNIEKVSLGKSEFQMLKSGWGETVASDTSLYKIIYNSGELKIPGYICCPNTIGKKLPLIIWNRGGDDKKGMLNEFLAWGVLGEIASWGFIVAASLYREVDEFGGEDVTDIINLVDSLSGFEHTDFERIGIEGWSRGGMMTYKVLTLLSNINCAVIIAGLSNLERNMQRNSFLKAKFERVISNLPGSDINEEIAKRSAVKFSDEINPHTSILFLHGTADEKISHQDSVEMYELMKKKGNPAEYKIKIFENGNHFLREYRKEVSEIRRNWFNKHLKLN